METKKVKKRNGEIEDFNPRKVNKVLEWATEGIAGVSASDVAVSADLNLFDGITSFQIHDILIESAATLISEDGPNYAKVAGNLLNYKLRKEVWKGKNPPKLYDLIKANVTKGRYCPSLLENYSEKDIHKLDEIVDHERDYDFEYGGLMQMTEKYLTQNRKTKELCETPQFAFVLIGMVAFAREKERLRWIKKFYDSVSRFKINIPTPILAGARSITNSYSSCCLIDVEDTKDSLFAANTAAGLATCERYGIGLNLSRIRPVNSPIRNGETLHSGVIPWLKIYQSTIHACQQGGARRGAGTVTFPIFHPEIETILELKNNQGTHENRVPHLDYCISIGKLFYKRYQNKEDITLIGSDVAPELYELYGTPQFEEAYLAYEKKRGIEKKKIPARELFAKFFTERIETGRIYCLNIDEANENSPWKDRVNMTNLCCEILHAIEPEKFTGDPEAEIGVCILGATNMLKMKSDTEHKHTCELLVRLLDNIIDIQGYSIKACENFAKGKRSLGIGVTNMAAWLASKGLNHDSKEAPQVVSDFMEKQQYYLMEASCNLAKERGPAPKFKRSSYYNAEKSPLDLYNKNIDKLVKPNKLDWKPLMDSIKKHGMRNMTLSAVMPAESSSICFNTTNGVEPITSFIIRKTSKGKTAIQVVPGFYKWKNMYKKKGDFESNKGIIEVNAAVVKWLDMASSFNLYYNSSCYEEGNIPLSVLAKDHFYASSIGLKTFYYCNSKKKSDSLSDTSEEVADDLKSLEVEEDDSMSCAGGACSL